MIRNQYTGRLAILYDRVLRHRKISKDKSDTLWNINLNVLARSMKGILMLFEAQTDAFDRDTEDFYNTKITKVEVTIEEIPNQLYSQGMRAYQHWDEARKFFLAAAPGSKRHPEVATVAKDLTLADVSLADFLTNKYALWLDLRTSDDDWLHGSGRRIENASEGVTIQITKMAEAAGALNIYLYVLMDAQLNIEDSRFRLSPLLIYLDVYAARSMIRSISAMDLLPKYSHSAIICGQTGCGKTVFILRLHTNSAPSDN